MAALATTNPTLLDIANATDPNGGTADVIEIMNSVQDILQDASFMNGNLTDGHKSSIRTGLPTPTWRNYYGGVQPTKGSTRVVTDKTGMLAAYAEIDVALAKLNGDAPGFRLTEDAAHVEGIAQEIASTMMYGSDTILPNTFMGFTPRFNSLSAENADNIIDAGGTGSDNGSIWLVVWGPRTVHGIVPKFSTAGLRVQDLGEETVEDASDGSNTGRYQAYRTYYEQHAGLCVKDWRYVVRICNIDKSDLSTVYTAGAFASGAHLPNLMFQAKRLVPNLNSGRARFYTSRDIITKLQQQLSAAVQQSTLGVANVGGFERETFANIPIGRVDALAADEDRVI